MVAIIFSPTVHTISKNINGEPKVKKKLYTLKLFNYCEVIDINLLCFFFVHSFFSQQNFFEKNIVVTIVGRAITKWRAKQKRSHYQCTKLI